MTPQELPAYLARLKKKVGEEGPPRAAHGMARAFHAEVSNVTLVESSHARGTRTPAAAGEPPSLISGALKRSLRLYAAVRLSAYKAMSHVKPLIVYARIQELGGTIRPRDAKALSWVMGGKRYFAQQVTLPARPYMRPTHRQMVANGKLRDAAIKAVRGLIP